MSNEWLGLSGKVCAITGAGGGIGSALAAAFGAQGARLLLLDRDGAIARSLAADLAKSGVDALGLECDVTDPVSVTDAAHTGRRHFGACDVLVNNAAILRPGALADLTLQDWNDLISVNLTGYFLCSQTFGSDMRKKRRGSLIHISSISGQFPQNYSGAYSVSKAGINMLSRCLASEWGEFGVRSNVVSPAMVLTPLSEPMYRDPEIAEKRRSVIPLRRIGRPTDIADAALFLASDRASYVSGEELLVDGAWQRNMLNMVPRPGYQRPDNDGADPK